MTMTFLRKAAAVALLATAASSVMAADLIVNGNFSSGATGWTQSGVEFTGGVATLNAGGDSLSQTFAGLVSGTVLDFSFLYDKIGTANGGYLTYDLLFSTNNFASSTSLIAGALSFNHSQGDDSIAHNALVLGSAGDVRVTFAGGNANRSYSIDNVSLVATAPVPEPETYAMMLAGLGAVGFMARRRKFKQA